MKGLNRQEANAHPPARRASRASHESCDSYETYHSQSTAPTSAYTSTQASVKETALAKFRPVYEEDVSPSTSYCPRSSVDTFDSSLASDEELTESTHDFHGIPPLPVYTHQVVDPDVRPSTPQDFARLFPSRERLSIRHDDFTPDGNMNLRVDTVVPGRRRQSMQLFHLRMYDLSQRDFSLRRYCRDSGREVCSSKRKYAETTPDVRPGIARSMSNALKSFSARKSLSRRSSGGSALSAGKRPASSYSYEGDDELIKDAGDVSLAGQHHASKAKPRATNDIKLEFSNYARVDLSRRGGSNSKRYQFEWWGHRYQWKRIADKNLGSVSFHLLRDGSDTPVAHIVPETRSPTQALDDEEAGGWVPPCHMWISDESIVQAMTDIADVIVATGLLALVDDCIKRRWQSKGDKAAHHRFGVPLTSRTLDFEYTGARSLMQNIFHRRASDSHSHAARRHRGALAPY